MRLTIKKVSAIAASALMFGMTMGVAAAANYPNPFVVNGNADVAIVYGTGSGVSSLDLVQAGNIQANLQSYMTGSTGSSASIAGEAVDLGSATKIYVNDSLNAVTQILSKTQLPTVLADSSFSGNVDATVMHSVILGANPRVTWGKQPTSSDDPNYALKYGISTTTYLYNETATFSKAVNFTSADSKGQAISLFGQKYTVGSGTDTSNLVLLQSATKLTLSSDSASQDVTIGGATYTIELVSASTTSATVQVTDSTGATESKEINEAASKKVNGVTIAVITADSNNLKYSASIIAGSEKVTFTAGSPVKYGETDTTIDGTSVSFGTGTPGNLSQLTISVYGADSDHDALKSGTSFTDPVFKTFKINYAGLSTPEDSTARDTITFYGIADDRMAVKFTDYRGFEKEIAFLQNTTGNQLNLMYDTDGHNISVAEKQVVRYLDYVTLGNENQAYLVKISDLYNDSSTMTNDRLKFTDMFSGEVYSTSFNPEGTGVVTIGGKQYTVTFQGASSDAKEVYNITIDQPDSTANVMVLYPTIQTAKGAKLAFYKPYTFNITNWDSLGTNLTGIKLPNGNGYTDITVVPTLGAGVIYGGAWNFSFGSTVRNVNTTATTGSGASGLLTVGTMSYNVTASGINNSVIIYAMNPQGTLNEFYPGMIMFEEKDQNSAYNAWVMEPRPGATSTTGLGVSDIPDTWSDASSSWSATSYTNSKLTKRADMFGTIVTKDTSDSHSTKATISYPDNEAYAQLYVAANDAVITPGATGGATKLGDILVKDSEVSSVSSKNLVVVGGSCINTVASNLLGGIGCGSSFTTATGIGSGQFLIQSLANPYSSSKIALLVAGFEAADTVNAATYLRTQAVDTASGKKYQGTSATSATLVTTTA